MTETRVPVTAAKRFVSTALQFGAQSGVTFGLPIARPFEHAIVTLSSAQPNRRWIIDATIREAYAIGIALHSFIEPRIDRLLPDWEMSKLTDAQRCILRCVAHFTSWLGLCPGTKITGGKLMSGKTKRCANRAAQALRLAAAAQQQVGSGRVFPPSMLTHGQKPKGPSLPPPASSRACFTQC